MLIFILILVAAGIILYFIEERRIKYYKTISANLSSMRVIQNMFELLSEEKTAEEKINELNKIIIDSYAPKYSSICLYNGDGYILKASNVDEIYKPMIDEIGENKEFKLNIEKNIAKYLTTTPDKTLLYKSAIERGIRSSMFIPIYYKETYLGFWLMEDELDSAFDKISKNELSKLKNNFGVFLEVILNREIIENVENTDKQTGLYTNHYLYTNIRKILGGTKENSFVMLKLNNMMDINEKYGRKIGNSIIERVTSVIKETIDSNTIVVRYSGIKFLMIFTNIDSTTVHSTIERLYEKIKSSMSYIEGNNIELDTKIALKDIKKLHNIEKDILDIETFIDNMDKNTIKIM